MKAKWNSFNHAFVWTKEEESVGRAKGGVLAAGLAYSASSLAAGLRLVGSDSGDERRMRMVFCCDH